MDHEANRVYAFHVLAEVVFAFGIMDAQVTVHDCSIEECVY